MNVICITGNLGKDAERKALPDGTPVLRFTVADSEARISLQSGGRQTCTVNAPNRWLSIW